MLGGRAGGCLHCLSLHTLTLQGCAPRTHGKDLGGRAFTVQESVTYGPFYFLPWQGGGHHTKRPFQVWPSCCKLPLALPLGLRTQGSLSWECVSAYEAVWVQTVSALAKT